MASLQDIFTPILTSPWFILGRNLTVLFLTIFWFALVFWTWRDAERRGARAGRALRSTVRPAPRRPTGRTEPHQRA